jgi:hypothetical protein
MKIHTGVLDMFESIEMDLTDEIMRCEHIPYLTFCGHSLGGALAVVASTYYGMMFHNKGRINCHTFGAPKVGNKDLGLIFNDHVTESYHFINNNDVVPYFPLVPNDYDLSYKNIVRFNGKKDVLNAHNLDTYIDNVRKYIYLMKMPHETYKSI